jgi:predicted unusual protein kinase regulating ubiquinone biosynthesis (AarF/ABC1/UbiB family)
MLRARYRRIIFFFGRVVASLIIWDIIFPRLGLRKWSRQTRPKRLRKIAVQFRNLAVNMGGVMIKVGQFLSSRVDVLPSEVTTVLSGLQDEVPPEKFSDIQRVAEADLGAKLEEKYLQFARQPLAAASLGQVHRAILHDKDARSVGYRNVVVKVQRPDIENIIATDLAALKTVGQWLKRYPPIANRADISALLNEFSKTLYEEIDYLTEGKNAETFATLFTERPSVYVPRVVWSHTTKKNLTLEDVTAIKITDYDAITKAGIDRADVAQRLFETYLKQIFEDGFFHADPHPGNLFVTPKDDNTTGKRDWILTFVDFGMVGRVPETIRQGLREMAIGVGTQDAARVIKSYQILGVLLPGADLSLIEQAEAKAFDRFWGKSMSELQNINLDEMHEFAKEYREIIYAMPFQVPSDILFLVRCIAILSGMCTGLNPDFNVWEGLTPFARKLMADEADKNWEYWFEEIGKWASLLLTLPRRLDSALAKIEQGDLSIKTPDLTRYMKRLERTNNKIVAAVLFTAFSITSVQLYLAGESLFAGILASGALISLGWIIKPRKS